MIRSTRRTRYAPLWLTAGLLLLGLLLLPGVALADGPQLEAVRQVIRQKGLSWTAQAQPERHALGALPKAKKGAAKTMVLSGAVEALPTSLDWRNHGGNWVSPVKNQGNCGSCWAFAGVAALESLQTIAEGTPGSFLNLSEQILVSCASENYGCDGGYMDVAADFLMTDGTALETCYPYGAAAGTCGNACANWRATAYRIEDYDAVPATVAGLKQALQSAPVQVTMDVYEDFDYYYRSGVYEYASGAFLGGHAVLLVGYVDTPGQYGGGHFIVKNSWGSSWGENGFFRIGYSQMANKVQFGQESYRYLLGERWAAPTKWTSAFGVNVGGWTSFDAYPRLLGDVNGDGRADIVGLGKNGASVALSTGSSFGAATLWVRNFGAAAGGWTTFDALPRLLGDANGDGKDDIVGFGVKGTYVALSTGSSFGTPTMWINSFGRDTGGWSSQNTYPRLLGDADGDGKDDIVGFGASGVYVALSTGSKFAAPKLWVSNYGVRAGAWTSYNTYPRFVGDVNGDGRADVVGCGGKGAYVSLSTGSSFGGPSLWVANYGPNAGGWSSQDRYPRLLGDRNNDDRVDLIGCLNTATVFSSSTGSSFAPAANGIADFAYAAGGWTSQNTLPRAAADVNDDGKADLVGFAADGVYVSLAD